MQFLISLCVVFHIPFLIKKTEHPPKFPNTYYTEQSSFDYFFAITNLYFVHSELIRFFFIIYGALPHANLSRPFRVYANSVT
ncbi:hypothetical protein B6D60_04175 [candidate division KSB1 bacterium 4484_87]|nr:MAG: hypothetical protein B6D60_04175 [candidate division KSB1 bacterium 4484_87]